MRAVLVWLVLGGLALGAVVVAAASPLLEWRSPVYIAAGLCGVAALSVMLFQPLLASAALPGLSPSAGRRLHRRLGVALIVLILGHVAGLWITSPPDVIDALTFTSPTPFAPFGVVAMWAAFAAALVAGAGGRLRPRFRRAAHSALVIVVVGGTVVHALLIDGTMGTISKWLISLAVLVALLGGLARLRVWRVVRRRPARRQRDPNS